MTQCKTFYAALILWGGLAPTAVHAQAIAPIQELARLDTTVQTERHFLLNETSLAQIRGNPNEERFLQVPDDAISEPLPEEELDILPEAAPTEVQTSPNDATPLVVEDIVVVGSTVFDADDFADILESVKGNTTFGALNNAVEQITQLYINEGYLTSRAVLPSQALGQGPVTIEVIEGYVSDIEVNGLDYLNESYITSRVGLGIDEPLNVNDLEEQLRLFQIDPNLDAIEVNIQSDEDLGASSLVLDLNEADPFFGAVFIDNYSPASVGSTRSGINLGHRNIVGNGDVLNLDYIQTFANGLDVWAVDYASPLNPMNGTLELSYSNSSSSIITSEFEALDIDGSSEFYRISFRQPLVRKVDEEFALSLGFDHRDGRTFIFNDLAAPISPGADVNGITKLSVIRFGQDYVNRDRRGAWTARSQFSWGTTMLDATRNSGNTADGQFFSWLGQVGRVQRLSSDHTLIAQFDVQLSGDNLLSPEGFTIGGAETLRGYRQGARNADSGWRFLIEDRITLDSNPRTGRLLQAAPFFNYGVVWNNADNPTQITNEHALAGLGLGLIFQPQNDLTMRLDFTIPLVDIDDRQNDLQDNSIYFRFAYGF